MTLPLASLPPSLKVSPDAFRPRPASGPSSIVVAVEYESCADELLLCGGLGRLRRPADPRAPGPLDIDLDSPLPFKRLGVLAEAEVYDSDAPGANDGFGFLLRFFPSNGPGGMFPESRLVPAPGAPFESGLGGKLDVRMPPRGGCGKELMLIVLRTVFCGCLRD